MTVDDGRGMPEDDVTINVMLFSGQILDLFQNFPLLCDLIGWIHKNAMIRYIPQKIITIFTHL